MIRRAAKGDIRRLDELLYDVQRIHAEGRPDIFKTGRKKYTDAELEAILADDERPVFVYEREGTVLGAELYRHVVRTAEETGCDSVTLNVWSVNGEAAAFYERMGMKPLKTMMETRLKGRPGR